MTQTLEQQARAHIKTLQKIRGIEVPRAASSALNKSAALVRTRVIRGVAKERKLKVKTVRERMRIKKSTAKTLKSTVKHYVRPVSAISQFTPTRRARLVEGKGTNRRGVRVAGRSYDSAFVARGNSNKGLRSKALGKKQVFRRKDYSPGGARLPLEKIEIEIDDATQRIAKKVAKRVMKQSFERLYVNDLRYRISKYAVR